LADVVAELRRGGYSEDTPVAVVQKASWPDEKILRGTLATIAATVAAACIDRTALIVVGRCLDSEYDLSRLYSPDFGHMYREAK
jgi:precorrin-4/cobalt-precorrin-4 C11-methyltransferase